MTLTLAAVTIDCDGTRSLWRSSGRPPWTDRSTANSSSDFASIGMPEHRDTTGWSLSNDDHPTWLFAKVPEPKTAKNRMHVDMATPDRDAEVARLIGLGATRVTDMNEWGYEWTVMQDPEGNEFCVAQTR